MKRYLLAAMCLVCAVAVAGPASAATLGLDDLIGTSVPGSPASVAEELVRLNQVITFYNSDSLGGVVGDYNYVVADGDPWGSNLPGSLPTATGGVQVGFNDGFTPFDLSSPYLYLLAKFANQDAFYYLGGFTGNIDTLVSPFERGGLSHITLFNPTQIPEGSTLMLLGFGLAGVGMVRRFMKR